ncbi:MAG: cupin domain-containing protein [Chloroflexi bacterium]|nr:cupin domain-containing protein [Chloroflexota bacterium]
MEKPIMQSKEKEKQEPDYEDRVFVRGIVGGYALKREIENMRSFPRVIRGKDIRWNGGKGQWQKPLFTPGRSPGQSLHIYLSVMGPGMHSQKHGHQNGAMFFILDGKGHDIHDGKRYDWQAGDALFLHEEGVVHQHFNDDPDKPMRVLVIKAKPMFNFLNLNFQGFVEKTHGRDMEYHPTD